MAGKTKTDNIHDLMPKYFRTRQNPNWKAIIDAIGQSDQDVANLVEEVRKQFFVKTSSRPYLDRLGANFTVSRPKSIGMDDADFRRYIPVLAYQPKQVKLAIDQLLDIFFFKESTTAFIKSSSISPFFLKDGWELNYVLDANNEENITFKASDFADISAATAEEIVATINRQAVYSFAIVFDDSITKTKTVRLFTKTVGSKGSVLVTGGQANISLQFEGFNTVAGNQASTIWTINKVGDTVTFQYSGGGNPSVGTVQVGDTAVIDIPNNEGSFLVESVDVVNGAFTFRNVLATPGIFDHSSNPNTFVRFFSPVKSVVYTKNLRAVSWEVKPGEFVVEMPASPPIVKRKLSGSAHINGTVATMTSRTSDSSLELDDVSDWPVNGGYFVLQPINEIQSHIKTLADDEVTIFNYTSRYQRSEQYYHYSSRSGNTLSGITPPLPQVAGVFEATITTAARDTSNIVTIDTALPHGFSAGENVGIRDTVPNINLADTIDGCFRILSTPTPTSFTYYSFGDDGDATGGVACVERANISNSGSLAYLTTARLNTGILGPYMWDLSAPFVLSSLNTKLTDQIIAGDALRSISVETNQIPSEEGYLVFGFGTENEEGPIRYFYKPNEFTLNIDPAYVFQNSHPAGSAVTMIRRRGPHVMSGLGSELPFYITDPAVARPILQDLIQRVKSVGIFINFIIRYPTQYYATIDVYDVGVDPG